MNRTSSHQKLVDDLLFALGSRPDVRLWSRQVGFDQARGILFGVKGESDLQGIISPNGRMLCIECKTGVGKLSKDQIRWRDMVLKFGALYIEARSIEQTLADFERMK